MKRKTAAFKFSDGSEVAVFEPPPRELGKEARDRVEPRARVRSALPLRYALFKPEAALMPASSHPASHPNQDSYAYGDSESDQRAVLDLAGHPVQSLFAELGGFVAKTRSLVAGQAPAAAKAIDDFGHGRGDGVTDAIAGRRHAGRGVPAGRSPNSFKLVLKGA